MEGLKTSKMIVFAGAALALALFAGCAGQDAAQKAQAAATQAASSASSAEAAANSAQQSAAAAQAAATRTEQAAADAKAAADRAEAIAMKTEGGGHHMMHHHRSSGSTCSGGRRGCSRARAGTCGASAVDSVVFQPCTGRGRLYDRPFPRVWASRRAARRSPVASRAPVSAFVRSRAFAVRSRPRDYSLAATPFRLLDQCWLD
jgi:hypothetical protein